MRRDPDRGRDAEVPAAVRALADKAKDAADQQEQMQRLSQSNERENAGTTSLGALLRAKLDNKSE